MMFLVLAVAIANLGLGYLAAAALMEPPIWKDFRFRLPRFRFPSRKASPPAASTPDTTKAADAASPSIAPAVIEPVVPHPATIAGVEELPAQWLQELAAAGVVAETFVEGAAQALKLEVVRYREQLVAAEDRSRRLAASPDSHGVSLLASELQSINRDWLERQTAVASMLAQRAGRLGDHEAAASTLEQLLLDQAAETQGICAGLTAPASPTEVNGGIRPLTEGIGKLIDQAHDLRDGMFDLLATLLRSGNRLELVSEASQLDPATGIPNRTGLESVFVKWWSDDPARSRRVSVVLVDVDRFARLNQRFGTRAGDQAIVCLGRLFNELVRKDATADRVARLTGESFLLMLGDGGPREALTAAERFRQTVEATTFEYENAEFELTVSCGVIEVGPQESTLDLLRRAGEALRFAKKAGRNRCSIDEGNGPCMLEPPQFPVKGRVLHLGEPIAS